MLVALEGIDGSGKTTVARLAARLLRRDGIAVDVTAEPTKGALGRSVRAAIRGNADPLALAFLFLADRAQHVEWMRRRAATRVVITDRYVDSTTAYQAAALKGRVPDALRFFRDLQARRFPAADLTIYLDLPPKDALARIAGRAVREPFERRRFLERVRRNYLRLAREGGHVVLDARQEAKAVAALVAARIRHRRAARGHRRDA